MKLPFWPNPQGYRDIKFGLNRCYELLERLGNPHLKLAPTIHIAGTNGKGSTLAFLKAIFTEAGLRVHSYTSPHLVNFNERINLAGVDISDDFLNEILAECKTAAELDSPIAVTFFEGTTIAAFLAFSRIEADVVLLETGMGGRLDATNVLPEVLCSIITPISFDHEEFLGNTLTKIAAEKAGIIKKNCPIVISKQNPEALEVIKNKAAELNSAIFLTDEFEDKFDQFDLSNLSLAGSYQKQNAAAAVTAIKAQRIFKISDDEINRGLGKAFWPARLQKITQKKLPNNCELYLDGSHNPQGAETILDFLESKKLAKVFVIFSMLKDKNCDQFLKIISRKIDHLIALEIPDEPKSRSVEEILKIAHNHQIKSSAAENFDDALMKIKCEEPHLILICGSLYLAGKFLETLN
jgi:dihydrofolate synthase/folylpolyglutamate synthase